MSLDLRSSLSTIPSPSEMLPMTRPYSTSDLDLMDIDRRLATDALINSRPPISLSDDVISKKSWWAYNDGTGPSALGNIWRVVKTVTDIGRDAVQRNSPDSPDQAILQCRSTKLNSSIMIRFFTSLKSSAAFEFSSYLCNTAIDHLTVECVKKHLSSLRSFYDDETAAQMSWVIPIVCGARSIMDANHIVTIVIRGRELFFFDPKGFSADKYAVDGEHTLADIVQISGEIFRPGVKMEIIENKEVCQWDVNNCGLYVGLFVYHSLVHNRSLDEFHHEMMSIPDIFTAREFFHEQVSKVPSDYTMSSEDSAGSCDPEENVDFGDIEM